MATGLETFLESLARIPGLAFLERFANRAKYARHAVRSGKERAEEIQQRTKDVKSSAGNVRGGKKAGEPPKAGATKKETTQNLRSQRRQQRSGGLDPDAAPAPRRRPGAPDLSKEAPKAVRDTSPDRDQGRSMRKRKEDI